MAKTVGMLIGIWVIIAGALLLTTVLSDATNDMVQVGLNDMAASANLSNMPGIEDAWQSYPVWKWFLFPLVGIIASGIVLYKNRDEIRNREWF